MEILQYLLLRFGNNRMIEFIRHTGVLDADAPQYLRCVKYLGYLMSLMPIILLILMTDEIAVYYILRVIMIMIISIPLSVLILAILLTFLVWTVVRIGGIYIHITTKHQIEIIIPLAVIYIVIFSSLNSI